MDPDFTLQKQTKSTLLNSDSDAISEEDVIEEDVIENTHTLHLKQKTIKLNVLLVHQDTYQLTRVWFPSKDECAFSPSRYLSIDESMVPFKG
ncbi:hypothetical protein QE152_g8980 [Popillia japonica]|uniref:Uncharacterized protein n=1 Tax=Popillia japonica TaxID=7064 RepID=A0AAW1M0A9_POPJA